MKPIPVVFHLGPLQLHTYGLGLAITFWFASWYLSRRLRAHGWDDGWVAMVTVWVVIAALVGARVVHVVANWPEYAAQPAQIPQVWHGGLSSFGGLLFGVPTGFYLARRRGPKIPRSRMADLVAPVLLASWALGRLLGPQLMVRGGGHPTTAWYGMYYAGEVGKRLPVPLFQSAMTFAMLLIAWRVERFVERRGGPRGLVMSVAVAIWGVGRFIEEHFWLARPGHPGDLAVEAAGIAFAVVGAAVSWWLLARARRRGWPEEPVEAGGETGGLAPAEAGGETTGEAGGRAEADGPAPAGGGRLAPVEGGGQAPAGQLP